MRAFWNVGRSCLASRTAHAPAPTPPNRPTAKTFVRPSTHGALKAARTLAGSRRLPHAHGLTGCHHVHPTSQHEAPGRMLCLENRPLPSASFSTIMGISTKFWVRFAAARFRSLATLQPLMLANSRIGVPALAGIWEAHVAQTALKYSPVTLHSTTQPP
jgi:hypothetical protein